MDLKKTKRGSFYWHQNQPYASVTNVLKVIDKPALRYWFGKEVYWAVVNEPSIELKAALNAPWKSSGSAKARGTAVHKIVEDFTVTGKVEVPQKYRGYASAFRKWVQEYNADLMEREKTIFNHAEKYAGTLDLLVNINNTPAIIDIKTGKDIYPESGLQLSAYLHGENVMAERIGVCLLQEDGNYKFEWMKDNFPIFLHAKKLWEWANEEDLLKVNYYGGQDAS